jgi:hypothetical protein
VHLFTTKIALTQLRKRYEGTKKIQSYERVTKMVRNYEKGTKLWKSYEVTNKVRSYEKDVSSAISALVGPFDRSDKVTWSEESLSGSGPDRKYVLRMPVFSPRFFLSSSKVVTWLPNVTKGHLIPSGFPWVCAYATGNCVTLVVTEGHVIPWKSPWGVLYDVRIL